MSDDVQQEANEEEVSSTGKTKSTRGVPSHLQMDFSKNENASALKPGFRNPANSKSKAQRKKKKGRR